MQHELQPIQDHHPTPHPLPEGGTGHGALVHHYYDKLLAAIMTVTRSVSTISSACVCEIKEAVQHAITTVLRRTIDERELLGVLDEMLTLSGHARVGITAGKAHSHKTTSHCKSGDVGQLFSACMAPDGIISVGALHMGEKERQIIELLVKELGASQERMKEEEASSHASEHTLSPSTT